LSALNSKIIRFPIWDRLHGGAPPVTGGGTRRSDPDGVSSTQESSMSMP
jgi:hypothetical protein